VAVKQNAEMKEMLVTGGKHASLRLKQAMREAAEQVRR
jgi:hypothetical protein